MRPSFSKVLSFAVVLVLVASLFSLAGGALAAGTIGLTSAGVPYIQDFNSLASANATTSSIVPTGWEFSESGTNANTTYRVGTGSDNAGDTYSFGAANIAERAFGGLRSGTLVPLIGAQFTNNTGVPITYLGIAYTGEQWRLGQNTTGRPADRLDFQLSTTATSLTSGTWADYNDLDFSSPVVAGTVGALNGNISPNRTALAFTITGLNIPAGASFWIRWADSDLIPGADDGLAVDDFSLIPNGEAAPLINLSISDVSADEGDSGTSAFSFTVSLSAPAGPGGVTFDIATADNTASAPADYAARSLTGQTIPAGSSSYSFDVAVNGDSEIEPNETFFVNVSSVTGAAVGDGQGLGTIVNDDIEACGVPATFIHAVQGSGTASPVSGSSVTIEGVVTGDYQGTGQFGGYYVQEEDADADADPATSEGIFVFNTSFPVSPGDKVRVSGVVTEFSNLTELTNISNVLLCSGGNTVTSTEIDLPIASLADWERYEGMLVRIPEDLTVTETFTLARFGEVRLSADGRLYNPTNVVAPGAPALALQAANNRRMIVLDDGSNQQNTDPTLYPAGGLSASNTLRSGYTVNGVSGVLEQRFGVYRLQPVGAVAFTPANPRPAAPSLPAGALKVASFNVLNYFNGDGLGGGFPTARGANSLAEFNRQRAKIISALVGMDADVVGLMELENDAAGSSAIEDLVSGLNAATAPGTYAFINTGVIGTDEIRVGLLYQPAVVTPTGSFAVLTTAVDPRFIDTLNRPVLAQTFALNSSGARLTVAVNHLKSKGSDCNAVGDPDTGDGQGNCNITRTRAAEALVDWLATDPTGSGDPDSLIIGDLNSYAMEDPITVIKNAGYSDLALDFIGASAYSYVFDGQAGYLDHALANASLAPQVAGVTEWHINADEPIGLDYNVEFKSANQVSTFYAPDAYRSSDHDPVIISLNPTNPAPVVGTPVVAPEPSIEGASVTASASFSAAAYNAPFTCTVDYGAGAGPQPGVVTGSVCSGPAYAYSTYGQYTVTVRVTDQYNAAGSASATHTVIFNWQGFFQPVDNLPALNVARAGTAIPVRFSLGGDRGLNIFAPGYPTATVIACSSGGATDEIEQTVSAGGSSLTYDAISGQYTYVWKTGKNWSNTCRQLVVKLVDGTLHYANFWFK